MRRPCPNWLPLTLVISLALCSLLSSACGGGQARDTLNTKRALWESQALTDYSYHFHRSCFCVMVDPVVIEVHGAEVTVNYEDGQPVPSDKLDMFPTIPGLFDMVSDAIAADPYSLEVEYDPTYGYPTRISIDYDKNTVDDEMGYVADELEIL